MQTALNLISSLVVLGTLWGSGWSWLQVYRRRQRGEPLWPYEPRDGVPWGLLDMALILLVSLGIQGMTILLADQLFDVNAAAGTDSDLLPEEQANLLLTFSVGTLLTLPFALFILSARTGATGRDLGLRPRRWAQDIANGFSMFLLIVVPVLLIQLILVQFFKPEHPLIELLMENPSLKFFVASGVMAVLVAPIVEEFLFRVVLQGWLENLASAWQATREEKIAVDGTQLVLGGRRRFLVGTPVASAVPVETADPLGGSTDHATSPTTLPMRPAWWPIMVSAALFAVAHHGHSSDPIPLFVFALGLGYLYQRTHRVLPCIIVHMLLNGFSLLQLAVFLANPEVQAPTP